MYPRHVTLLLSNCKTHVFVENFIKATAAAEPAWQHIFVLPEALTRLRVLPVVLLFPLVRWTSIFFHRLRITDGTSHFRYVLTVILKRYHGFISSPLRRVYLVEDTSHAFVDGLNAEITLLKARIGTPKRDKDLLMDRCEATQSFVSHLTSDERTARVSSSARQRKKRARRM